MSNINIRRDVTDPFYRYKMERLVSKIEGKGNGIKTVIANLPSVAHSLARPPSYVIKYFGFELGAQTNTNPADDRWIINGAHDSGKLQDHLDGFISRFVLCKKCKNPETDVQIKDERITLDCKACGQRSDVDPRLKLSSFIIKNQPKKGKKDKSAKKAARKARKDNDGENGDHEGSPSGGSDQGDDNDDVEVNGGSDDELTRRINAEAKELDDSGPKDFEWTVDTSEAAVKARAQDLPDDLKRALVIDAEDAGEGEESVYDQFGTWLIKTAEEKGDINQVDNVDIYLKAKELGVDSKHRTLTVLAQTLFTENIVKEVDVRAPMLKKFITSDRHEKAFLGGTERFVGTEKPKLIPQVSAILIQYYNNDLVSEETFQGWGTKASKKYVDLATSRKVRKSAEQFMKWLEEAEEEESDDDE